jgi:hypothetical protein
MERATAYRATVDAAYRQYTADHGYTRTGNRTNNYSVVTQPVTGDVPRGGAETVSVLVLNSADDLGYQAPQIPADVVLTGAEGRPRDGSSILRRREGRSGNLTLGKRESPMKAFRKLRLTSSGSLEVVLCRLPSRGCLTG